MCYFFELLNIINSEKLDFFRLVFNNVGWVIIHTYRNQKLKKK